MPAAARRRAFATLCATSFLSVLAVACASTAGAPHDTPLPTGTRSLSIPVDDISLSAHLFGAEQSTIVILSHMRPNDQRAWYAFAEQLSQAGYTALTFDFRGYGESGGDVDDGKLDDDLVAVVQYARGLGKQRIFLVGASMGATTSLVVAQQADVDAVVAISPPAQFDEQDALKAVPTLTKPKLFIASELDAPALDFDDVYAAAAEPKEEQVYPGNAHGTDLFDPSKNTEAASVGPRILSFLREQGGP